jgi:hypothetical protein
MALKQSRGGRPDRQIFTDDQLVQGQKSRRRPGIMFAKRWLPASGAWCAQLSCAEIGLRRSLAAIHHLGHVQLIGAGDTFFELAAIRLESISLRGVPSGLVPSNTILPR